MLLLLLKHHLKEKSIHHRPIGSWRTGLMKKRSCRNDPGIFADLHTPYILLQFHQPFSQRESVTAAAGIMTLANGQKLILLLMPLFLVSVSVSKKWFWSVLLPDYLHLLFATERRQLDLMLYLAIILHGVCFDFFVTDKSTLKTLPWAETGQRARANHPGYTAGTYIGSRVQGLIQQKNEFVDANGSDYQPWLVSHLDLPGDPGCYCHGHFRHLFNESQCSKRTMKVKLLLILFFIQITMD